MKNIFNYCVFNVLYIRDRANIATAKLKGFEEFALTELNKMDEQQQHT